MFLKALLLCFIAIAANILSNDVDFLLTTAHLFFIPHLNDNEIFAFLNDTLRLFSQSPEIDSIFRNSNFDLIYTKHFLLKVARVLLLITPFFTYMGAVIAERQLR